MLFLLLLLLLMMLMMMPIIITNRMMMRVMMLLSMIKALQFCLLWLGRVWACTMCDMWYNNLLSQPISSSRSLHSGLPLQRKLSCKHCPLLQVNSWSLHGPAKVMDVYETVDIAETLTILPLLILTNCYTFMTYIWKSILWYEFKIRT